MNYFEESCLVWSEQTGLLGGNVAPLLDDGSLHLVRVCLGPGTDFFRNVNTLLHGHQLGNQLGHLHTQSVVNGVRCELIKPHYLVTRLDWLQSALLYRMVHHHGLDAVVTDDGTLGRKFQSVNRELQK